MAGCSTKLNEYSANVVEEGATQRPWAEPSADMMDGRASGSIGAGVGGLAGAEWELGGWSGRSGGGTGDDRAKRWHGQRLRRGLVRRGLVGVAAVRLLEIRAGPRHVMERR